MNKAYFSPGTDCKSTIIQQLENASSNIQICVFTISDNDITKAIMKAYDRGVHVTIITDNDKTNDRGSDVYHLLRHGIEVRVDNTSNHMHHKFAIFDAKRLITGSFNWTRSASKYNHENILLLDTNSIVQQHVKLYEKLWEEMTFFY